MKKRLHKSSVKPKVRKSSPPKKFSKPSKNSKKPAIIEERINTGIGNLDALIEGGFEKGSINLIAGPSGSGKSIFATQFLIEGLKNGEKCLYVTFEEKKEQFYNNMFDFGWNLKEYEDKGGFTFLEYTPEKVNLMLEEGGGSIESVVLAKKISRIVIDSITSFELFFKENLERKEATLKLFNMMREWGCTSLVSLEKESFMDSREESVSLDFEADSIILIYFLRIKDTRERYLEVLKMRSTKHSSKIYKFSMDKTGITVEKRPVSRGISKTLST